ncbi:hypothetical protein [Ruegeria sp. Ofav3-42]|uniref:hypothetical protein n=1 Tax=Ruegeria sp. Ofav3-42 TaxID=2917759 RepID=UPI001EF6EAC4|nr:hypothetical protein [Ruegeria sp. Ofav3-42]MCG7521610.1 hypothetical protein [Ruegeria sp. Ofav3-42]
MTMADDTNYTLTMADVQRLLDDVKLQRHEDELYETVVAQKVHEMSESPDLEPGHYKLADLGTAYDNVIQALQRFYDIGQNLQASGETGTMALDGGDVLDACNACCQATDAMTKMQWRWEELHPMFAKGGSEWTKEQMGRLKDGASPED